MADQPQDQLSLPKTDAGILFRLEMWATNAILGYWWIGVIAIVSVLAGVAIYAFVDGQQTASQRKFATQIEQVTRRVDRALIDRSKIAKFTEERRYRVAWTPSFEAQEIAWPPVLRLPLDTMLRDFGNDEADHQAVLTEAGDELLAIAAAAGGTAGGAQAALLAAELYRIAEQPEARRKALDKARTARAPTLRFSAESALAQLELSQGNLDAAEAILRPWIDERHGWFGQKAAFDLARAYSANDRKGDAVATLQDLQTRWPTTVFVDDIEDELEALGEGGSKLLDGALDGALEIAPGDSIELAPAQEPTE